MKTYRRLYPQVCSFQNLLLAFRSARKGKRGQPSVATFEFLLEPNLLALQRALQARTYAPGPYRSFYIHEPKRRLISAAPFPDRVVHHALCNVIEPIFERRFSHDSYANRLGKGTHRALDRCTHYMRRYRYVLPCDVRQHFPSIDHAILRGQIARVIADEDVLWLVDTVLAGSHGVRPAESAPTWFPGDDLLAAARPRGLPIGNLTSQFWSNVYLNDLDQFVRRDLRCRAYLRYVDDFLLFADDLAELWSWRLAVIEQLAALRLLAHEARAQPRPVTEGVPFLGWTVFPDHRRLRRHKAVYYRRRFRYLLREWRSGRLSYDTVSMSVRSWVAHARHGDTQGLRRSILSSERILAYPGMFGATQPP